jgi:hypothetical protein
MIQANELRLGNWIEAEVNFEYQQIQVFEINEDTLNGFKGVLRSSTGIPLTEDWLLKLGFEKDDGESDNPFCTLRFSNFEFQSDLSVNFERVYVRLNNKDLIIEYVHQLQNLYFALTGAELTITEK